MWKNALKFSGQVIRMSCICGADQLHRTHWFGWSLGLGSDDEDMDDGHGANAFSYK